MVLNEGDLVVVSESQFVFMGYSTLKKLTLIASGKERVKGARRLYRRHYGEE